MKKPRASLDHNLLKDIFYVEDSNRRTRSRTEAKPLTISETMETLSDSELTEVVGLVKARLDGSNIPALKIYRTYSGADLRQAKIVIGFLQRAFKAGVLSEK